MEGFWGVGSLYTLTEVWADEKGRAEFLGVSWQTYRGTRDGGVL